jgi:subtilisin-like proprotein convertase family protein
MNRDEDPIGKWTIRVFTSVNNPAPIHFTSWQLTIYGEEDVQDVRISDQSSATPSSSDLAQTYDPLDLVSSAVNLDGPIMTILIAALVYI